MISGELTPAEEAELARAVAQAEEISGLKFSVHLGPHQESAVAMLKALDDPARHVLVLVDAPRDKVEIATGAKAQYQLTDQEAPFAVATMRSSFEVGDVLGGVVRGIQQLGQAAHKPPTLHVHPTFTDLD